MGRVQAHFPWVYKNSMTRDDQPLHDFRVVRAAAPLRHSVIESIRQAIAVGRFKAGDRMPEKDLCVMTGVSRTLVREALRQLESEGLIEVIAHKGPVVATITVHQAADIYKVREVLEGLAAGLFAERASDRDLRALKQAMDNVREAYKSPDVRLAIAAKNKFYDQLIAGSGNEALGASLRMLNSRTMVLRGRSLKAPSRQQQSLLELDALIAALEARDPQLAQEVAMDHVRRAAAAALKTYQAGAPVQPGARIARQGID